MTGTISEGLGASSVFLVHRDERMAVVHKPTGMLVHRGMGADRDEAFLLQAVRDLLGCHVHPIHRLDRPTSGLVTFALDSEMAKLLQREWQEGRVRKTYHAVVRGWPSPESGLHCEALDDPDTGRLQEATTRFQLLERVELPWPQGMHGTRRLSLMELEPVTGRFHQLRRHFSRLAHPVAGDTTHGCRHLNHELQARLGWWRLLLFAHRLELTHPVTGEPLVLEDALERGIAPWWQELKALEMRCA